MEGGAEERGGNESATAKACLDESWEDGQPSSLYAEPAFIRAQNLGP